MAINAYSICPGGTGKKIKFCCSDLLDEFEQIERMIDGQQHLACLKHLERLEKTHPGRACLLATKTLLLRLTGQDEEAKATAEAFLRLHPDNPVAMAEWAIVTVADQGGRAALGYLQRAIVISQDRMHGRLYEAMAVLSRVLAAEGQFLAARALTLLQLTLHRDDREPLEFMVQLNASPAVPLVVKDDRMMAEAPAGAAWKPAFDKAMELSNLGQLTAVAERLAALAAEIPDAPPIWQNLAMVRAWLADLPGAAQAWRKYASLDVGLEAAAEAEALAMFFSEGGPLGDAMDVVDLEYPVSDAEALNVALLSSPRASLLRADLSSLVEEGEPPPKSAFYLFDRPLPESGQPRTAESVPNVLGQLLLWGKQTDREARVVALSLPASALNAVQAYLGEVGGSLLGAPSQTVVDQTWATAELLHRNFRLPDDAGEEEMRRILEEYVQRTLYHQWPQLPLGVLDGKTPQQAADDDAYRTRVQGAILVLEFMAGQTTNQFDANRLRSQLGLPLFGPIDPTQTAVDRLPLVRLTRVEVEKLSDEQLLSCYHRALAFTAREALIRLARSIVQRPSLAEKYEERQQAFGLLARQTADVAESLGYIDKGRQASAASGRSCASWDLMELSVRFEMREAAEVSRLLTHLQTRHLREPGVAEAINRWLISIGAIRPDGTPAVPPRQAAGAAADLTPPGQAAAEPGKIWTPGGATVPGEKPKLWTPDMG
jgi:hypothetical protein